MTDFCDGVCLSQKEHACPNRLIQNVFCTAKTPRAACIGDRGRMARRQLPFACKEWVPASTTVLS